MKNEEAEKKAYWTKKIPVISGCPVFYGQVLHKDPEKKFLDEFTEGEQNINWSTTV